jgi:hypothetical protein
VVKRIKKSAARKTSPARRPGGTAKPEAAARLATKQARAIEMLRSKEGASLAALMEVTGWQQHSVRGFLAGIVRKRLKLHLVSAVDAGARTYRISGKPTAPTSKTHGGGSKSP